MLVLLQILFSSAQSQCQTKSNGGPTQLYPTLGSPMILDLGQYFIGSNLQFTFQGGLNGIIYQTTLGPELNVNLNGTVISSCQQQDNLQVNDPKFGTFAFLTKNTSGYYVYELQVSDLQIHVQQVGDGIQVPFYINCFNLLYQQLGLFVSCVGSKNEPIIYYYDLTGNPSSSYPAPQLVNFTLDIETISDSYIIQYNYNSLVLGYSSNLSNQSTVLQVNLTNNTQQINSTIYYYVLNGLWVQQENGLQILLFINFLQVKQYPNINKYYDFPGLQFLDFSIQFQFNLFITIATQESILQLEYALSSNSFNLIAQIPYPNNFNATVESNMQLFADYQFIIVSNGYKIIIYELINPNQVFWSYSLDGQSNLQYDASNQILIIIMQQTIFSYQLFVPRLAAQFDTTSPGQLIVHGNLQQTCSIQLNYSVIFSNNTKPLPNFQIQNYSINYPRQQLQGLSNLFVGQNLSFNISSNNFNTQIVSVVINFFEGQSFNYINAFLNPFDIEQYMIVYQLKKQNGVYVIYCSLQFCTQPSMDFGFIKLPSQLQSITVGANFYGTTSNQKQQLELIIFVNSSTISPVFYNCIFEWFDSYALCTTVNFDPYLPFPNSQILQVEFSGLSFYILMNNPSAIFLLEGTYIPQQFQTRQIFTNIQDYTNLLFLDNIYELSINIASTINNLLTQLTSILYPIQQGNTSVGVGLLRQGIFIAQIDTQGNQQILYYDNIILTQTNFLQTIQPQQVQIPSGVVIQFPIISTFSSNKFYLVWNFKGQNQIAVLQSSSDINSMLFQSIYVSYQISSLNAVSIADYDQLFCISSTGLVTKYFIINKYYMKIVPDNLLSELQSDIQVNITAFNSFSFQSIHLNYNVVNQIFDLEITTNYLPIFNLTLFDANSFLFNPQNYYNGMVNSYQGYNNNNELNNVQGPISQLNGIIKIQPKPQAFQMYTGYEVLFQNNLYLYVLENLYIGSYRILYQFIGMVNCPILYYSDSSNILSICQDSSNDTFRYFFQNTYQTKSFLFGGFGFLISGEYFSEYIYYLNYVNMLVFVQNSNSCFYPNSNIDSYKQIAAIYYKQSIICAVQLLDSQEILIIKSCSNIGVVKLGPIINGEITSISLDQIPNNFAEYKLMVLTNQVGIIYYFNINQNNILQIVSYSLISDNMNGISCSFVNDHVIAIYETSPSNYLLIVYEFSLENQIFQSQLPIIAYYSFYQENILNFYYTQLGQVLFLVDTGFSFLQFDQAIYVGINNQQLQSTLIYSDNEYEVVNSMMEIVIGNPFQGLNVTLNLTLVNYQGLQLDAKSFSLTTQFFTLLAISILSIAVFFTFACIRIYRKKQWE